MLYALKRDNNVYDKLKIHNMSFKCPIMNLKISIVLSNL